MQHILSILGSLFADGPAHAACVRAYNKATPAEKLAGQAARRAAWKAIDRSQDGFKMGMISELFDYLVPSADHAVWVGDVWTRSFTGHEVLQREVVAPTQALCLQRVKKAAREVDAKYAEYDLAGEEVELSVNWGVRKFNPETDRRMGGLKRDVPLSQLLRSQS